jgi:hypothetical protein
MLKNLTAIIAGTLMALATGPALAQGQNVGQTILDLEASLATVQETVDNLQNLLGPKTIFVTSEGFTGDLVTEANTLLGTSFAASEGLEAGDALCQDLADASVIVPRGEYVALLSTDDVNANARLTPSIGLIIDPYGTPIAANLAYLFNTRSGFPLLDLISLPWVDELGAFRFVGMWTGSDRRGLATSRNCQDWTSTNASVVFGTVGSSGAVDSTWLDLPFNATCDFNNHLYCVQR